MTKTRTMYMHTLDGKPASLCVNGGDCWMAFDGVGARRRVPLHASLVVIRREQKQAALASGEPFIAKRFGYVRVEVPHV